MTELPSGLVLDQVDESIRIQDDLFGHVSGRWLRDHEIPADRSSDGAFLQLRELSEQRVREIVEEAAEVDADGTPDRIGTLYRMFMDTEAIEAAGAAPLEDLLARITSAADLS